MLVRKPHSLAAVREHPLRNDALLITGQNANRHAGLYCFRAQLAEMIKAFAYAASDDGKNCVGHRIRSS